MTLSVIYYSTYARKNEIYLLIIIYYFYIPGNIFFQVDLSHLLLS